MWKRWPSSPFWMLLLFALSLRVATVLALSTQHGRPVAYEHGEIARRLLDGKGFSIEFLGAEGPTSQQAPLYPLLVAAAYWSLGIESAAALLAIQLAQCLAGVATVACVVWLARTFRPDRPSAAWLAGVAASVYPPHLYMITHVQVATWAALLATLCLALAAGNWGVGGWKKWGLLGGSIAALMLFEPILALAAPIFALAYAQRERAAGASARTALVRAGLAACVALTCIAPWLVRNYRVHGEFVFIKSTFGYAFWQGNNPASWGTDKIPKPSAETIRLAHDGSLASVDRQLREARHETLYIDDVVLKPRGYDRFRGLSEPARSRLLGDEARAFIRERPADYAALCWRRLRYFLLFDETNPKASHPMYRASTVAWLVLAFVGACSCGSMWRKLWPTWAMFAVVALFHTLTVTSARFRAPIEPLSFVWPAIALAPALSNIAQAANNLVRRVSNRTVIDEDPIVLALPNDRTKTLISGPSQSLAKRKAA